jgi:hypothetical protein
MVRPSRAGAAKVRKREDFGRAGGVKPEKGGLIMSSSSAYSCCAHSKWQGWRDRVEGGEVMVSRSKAWKRGGGVLCFAAVNQNEWG